MNPTTETPVLYTPWECMQLARRIVDGWNEEEVRMFAESELYHTYLDDREAFNQDAGEGRHDEAGGER